jgi:hypothetical protein
MIPGIPRFISDLSITFEMIFIDPGSEEAWGEWEGFPRLGTSECLE